MQHTFGKQWTVGIHRQYGAWPDCRWTSNSGSGPEWSRENELSSGPGIQISRVLTFLFISVVVAEICFWILVKLLQVDILKTINKKK